MEAGRDAVPEWFIHAAWEAGGALLFVDATGTVQHWNRAAARLYLLSEAAEGVPFHHLFQAGTLAEAEAAYRAVALGGTLAWQGWRRRTDGGRLWINATWSAIRDPESGATGLLEQARDDTAGRHELTALRSSEALLARLVDTAGDGLLAFDSFGRIVFANPAAGVLLGLSPRELLSRRYDASEWGWSSPGTNPGVGFAFLSVTRTGEPLRDFEVAVRRGDGTETTLLGEAACWAASPAGASGASGAGQGVIVSLRDQTARRRAEAAEAERRERELLTRRLIAVEEAERRRIAGELHDELGAMLSGLRWLLESTPESATTDATNETASWLAEARNLAAQALGRTRDLCLDLRPASLDDLGLTAACEALAQRLQRRSCLSVEVNGSGLTTQVPEPAATAAYRIVQEALTNAGRHSAASSVVVYLTAEEGLLRVTIHDDGQGFDAAGGKPGHRSSGLSGMRDRAQAAGGSLEIHSAPGEGTIVMAEFALLTVAEERAE